MFRHLVETRFIHKNKDWLPFTFTESNGGVIRNRQFDTRLEVRAAKAEGMQGSSPILVVADELSTWAQREQEFLVNSIIGSRGKVPNARIVLCGLAPASDNHVFAQMMDERKGSGGVFVFQADDSKEDRFTVQQYKRANPMYQYIPELRSVIKEEAAVVKRSRNFATMAGFYSQRLNLGTSKVLRDQTSELLTVGQLDSMFVSRTPPMEGPSVVGIDSGETGMAAVCIYWYQSGAMVVRAAFPTMKRDLKARAKQDGVGFLYDEAFAREELLAIPVATQPLLGLLESMRDMIDPGAIFVGDYFKTAATLQALSKFGVGEEQYQGRTPRGSGIHGYENYTLTLAEVEEGRVKTTHNKLFAHAISCVAVKHGSNSAVVDVNGKSPRVDMVDAFLLAITLGRATRDGLKLAASRTAKPGKEVDNISDGRWRDFFDKPEEKEGEAASG